MVTLPVAVAPGRLPHEYPILMLPMGALRKGTASIELVLVTLVTDEMLFALLRWLCVVAAPSLASALWIEAMLALAAWLVIGVHDGMAGRRSESPPPPCPLIDEAAEARGDGREKTRTFDGLDVTDADADAEADADEDDSA